MISPRFEARQQGTPPRGLAMLQVSTRECNDKQNFGAFSDADCLKDFCPRMDQAHRSQRRDLLRPARRSANRKKEEEHPASLSRVPATLQHFPLKRSISKALCIDNTFRSRSFAYLECSLSDKLGAGRLKFRDRSRCRQAFDNLTAGSYKLFGLSIKHHQTVELCEVLPPEPCFEHVS